MKNKLKYTKKAGLNHEIFIKEKFANPSPQNISAIQYVKPTDILYMGKYWQEKIWGINFSES